MGWDIHVLTQETLDAQLDVAVGAFSKAPNVTEDLAENLVAQGFFTFDDLSVIEPDQLAELGGLTAEQCDVIVEYADVESLKLEAEERKAKEQARIDRAAAQKAHPEPVVEAEAETNSDDSTNDENTSKNGEAETAISADSETETADATVEEGAEQTVDSSEEEEKTETEESDEASPDSSEEEKTDTNTTAEATATDDGT